MQSHLTLHKTYYNQGFWNIPVDLDSHVRKDEGPITLLLGKYRQEIQAHVNRSANQNGTARIMGKRALRDWFQQNYAVMDNVPVRFVTPNLIVLGGTSRDKWDNPLNMRILKAKVTEQGVIIPKSLLPDVDVEEVLIREYNGVIEVAPADENGNFPLRELGRKFDPNRKGGIPKDDPLWELGRNPVYDPEITDGSVNHDKYIYGL